MTNHLIAGLDPVHPGDILREDVLPTIRVSKTDIARRLGLSRQSFYDLINAKVPVSVGTALRLERLFGGSAEMWLNLQRDYDLAKIKAAIGPELEKIETLEAA